MSDYNPTNHIHSLDDFKTNLGIPPKEAYDHFYRRTNNHIYLVRENLYLWSEKYPDLSLEILRNES